MELAGVLQVSAFDFGLRDNYIRRGGGVGFRLMYETVAISVID